MNLLVQKRNVYNSLYVFKENFYSCRLYNIRESKKIYFKDFKGFNKLFDLWQRNAFTIAF